MRKGFSLAELLLAALLILVSALALVSLGLSLFSSQRQSSDSRQSQELARQVLEEQIYWAQSNPESAFWQQNGPYAQQEASLGGNSYVCQVYVRDVGVAADPGRSESRAMVMKRVEVMVAKQGGRLEARLGRLIYAP